MDFLISPLRKPLTGEIVFLGDKSVSVRLVLLSLILKGKITLGNLPFSEDVKSSLKAVNDMGVKLLKENDCFVLENTEPLRERGELPLTIYCGNSATLARLFLGLSANLPGIYELSGDDSLSNRPMMRVVEPLRKAGLNISFLKKEGCLPLRIESKGQTEFIEWENKASSAQVDSSLLFASLSSEKPFKVSSPHTFRDHTERLFAFLFARENLRHSEKLSFLTKTNHELYFYIPGDISSAAYFILLALLKPGSDILIKDVLLNDSRTAFIRKLQEAGGAITLHIKGESFEKYGDVRVTASSLKAFTVEPEEAASMIDELPLLAAAMAFADGTSEVSGAWELRVKESDRIACLISQLKKLGVSCEEKPDGFKIFGGFSQASNIVLDSFGDHRLAMTFSVLASLLPNPLMIMNADCVNISCPDFFEKLKFYGGKNVE